MIFCYEKHISNYEGISQYGHELSMNLQTCIRDPFLSGFVTACFVAAFKSVAFKFYFT